MRLINIECDNRESLNTLYYFTYTMITLKTMIQD